MEGPKAAAEQEGKQPCLFSGSLERGSVAEKLHVQIMLGVHGVNGAGGVNTLLTRHLTAKFGEGVYKVTVSELTGRAVHGDVLTAMGYTLKDAQQPHFKNICSALFTDELKEV